MIPGVTFHPRASWQYPNRPVTGPAVMSHMIDTYALHYTAADDLIDGDPGEHADDLPGYLRNMQASYLNARERGYSLGYSYAVDWLGGVWEIRGFDIRCAANRGWNERTIAVLCLVDGQDSMTLEAVRSVNAIYAEADRRFRPLALKGHRDIGATACPGVGIYSQIRAGVIRPQARPVIDPPPTLGDHDMHVHEPFRNSDTRKFGTKIQPGVDHEFGVNVPSEAVAVCLNVAAVDVDPSGGWLAIWGDGDFPGTSVVNTDPARYATNGYTIVPCPNRTVKLRSSAAMHVVLDVCGWIG